jgi:tRNA(Ile2) C34 agmatinyltransferase TiaS
VAAPEVGAGGHTYLTLESGGRRRRVAAYEPTGDLRRTVRRLAKGDRVRAYGGVRRPSSKHPAILNLEKFELIRRSGQLERGTYIASPRANRHLTKPLIRYGRETTGTGAEVDGWLTAARPERALARSR